MNTPAKEPTLLKMLLPSDGYTSSEATLSKMVLSGLSIGIYSRGKNWLFKSNFFPFKIVFISIWASCTWKLLGGYESCLPFLKNGSVYPMPLGEWPDILKIRIIKHCISQKLHVSFLHFLEPID